MRLLSAAGALVCLLSLSRLETSTIDLQFLLLASFTILVGSRISIQIPKTQAEISVSDTFVFLTILLYGGEAAVLLAAAEAFCSSFRFNKKWITRCFNAGLLACSTFLTVSVLRLSFGLLGRLPHEELNSTFIAAILLMASVQYLANSGLAAVRDSFKLNKPLWETWHKHYLWTSITYFAGASAAGLITKLVGELGAYAFAAAFPIIAIIYFTYQTYKKNIESAERHASEQQRISQALQESEAHFRGAFDHAAIGMALVDVDGRWLRVNSSLCRLVGYEAGELLRMKYQDLTHTDDLESEATLTRQLVEDRFPSFHIEKRYIHRNGEVVWALLSVSLVRTAQGEPLHLITQVQDITDRKRAEARLVHDAFHDALTGLPNRALFMDHLELAVARAKRHRDYIFAVLFLDFDRFKVINDSLGHQIGDQLLIGIAERLQRCVRTMDTIARLGGDEFTILLEDLQSADETECVVARIQKEMARPFNLSGHEVYTSASIGVAPSTLGYAQAEEILRDADTAMYRAKQLGKARHVVFSPDMHDNAMKRLSLETDLRRAVERGELLLHYQPIVSLGDGEVVGFEALVRWRHPQRGMVSPGEFIPIAEETGLILPVGQWVLGEACRQMKEWQRRHSCARRLFMSVNLSSKQFTQPDLIEQIIETLREMEMDPQCLKLEITESLLMGNIETANMKLEQLRRLGVELSMDDFGTGYSSLSYLHRLPIDTLKIDRSFVMQMSRNDENKEIVRTIVTLAKSLEMKVIAEGVETEEQRAQLQALRCDSAQGYLFYKPLEADKVSELLWLRQSHQASTMPAEEIACVEDVEVASVTYVM